MEGAIRDLGAKRMTRRTLIEGALSCAVAAPIVPAKAFADFAANGVCGDNGRLRSLNQNGANLYSFSGLRPGTTVIAVTWVHWNSLAHHGQKRSQVTVHAGSQKWMATLPGDSTDSDSSEQDGCRVSATRVAAPCGVNGAVIQAVVIEIPERRLPSLVPMAIWAERVMHTGERKRIGSPFVASLVAEDTDLAAQYHRIFPSDDRGMLTGKVIAAIAGKARKSGLMDNPNAHGRRLASRLLPDVLYYNPLRPSGFTFAAQNGRHPNDLSDLVVDTVLSGSPAVGRPTAGVRLQERFPFPVWHDSVA